MVSFLYSAFASFNYSTATVHSTVFFFFFGGGLQSFHVYLSDDGSKALGRYNRAEPAHVSGVKPRCASEPRNIQNILPGIYL